MDSSPPGRVRGARRRQLIAGFNVYRTASVSESEIPGPRIHTCFRGVPVASSATVERVETDLVVFRVSRYQANVLRRAGVGLIVSPLHGMVFQAIASEVDVDECLVSFSQFVRHHEPVHQRSGVRVEPDELLPTGMRCAGRWLPAILLDVSVSAFALLFRGDGVEVLQEGREVEMDLPDLPGLGTRSGGLPGRLIRVTPWIDEDPTSRRAVVALSPDDSLTEALRAYVRDRQAEILAEMSRLAPG